MAARRTKKIKIIKPIRKDEGLSEDTKTILVVVTLLMAYPVGLFLMFMWMKWPVWLKFIISVPLILIILTFLGILLMVAIFPRKNWERSSRRSIDAQPSVYIDRVEKTNIEEY